MTVKHVLAPFGFFVQLLLALTGVFLRAELLPYGNFENANLSAWSETNGAVLVGENVYEGQQAARAGAGDLRAVVATQPGQTYRVTGWVRILSESGSDWGGFRVAVSDFASWQVLENSGALLTATHGSDWFRVSLTFEAFSTSTRLQIGYFGGAGRQMTVHVDAFSFVLFDLNEPPLIHSASLTPSAFSTLPGEQTFSVEASDPDGTIAFIHWDFGDGGQSAAASGTRRITAPGSHTARVTVYDDSGASAFLDIPWSAVDPRWPALSVTVPADGMQTEQPNTLVTGHGAGLLLISSDRGHSLRQTVAGAFNLSFPLAPGWNWILVQIEGGDGRIRSLERRVRHVPAAPLALQNITLSSPSVERWEPLEIRFDVQGSAATHREHPWRADPPPGLNLLDGISVDLLFSPDGGLTTHRRPAYWHQPYRRERRSGREWLYPESSAGWRALFAPPSVGTWQVEIEVSEAKGTVRSVPVQFTVTEANPTSNRGPVRVSPNDPRYFETADGRPFLGSGHGGGMGPEAYSYDLEDQLAAMGAGNQDLLRVWIAGHLWGSAWQPWASRTLPYDGTVPATGLSHARRYGDGLASWRLDAANPLLFQGFQSGHAALIPGRSYRLRVRWMTEGVSGPANPAYAHGVCVKFVDWPEPGQTHTLPALIPHVTGDSPWHLAESDVVAQSDFLPNLAMILENSSAGAAYVDEISLREVLAGGALGPELLRTPRANAHLGFDPRRGAGLEAALRSAQAQQVHLRLVIAEKQDWLLNQLGPAATPAPNGEQFYAAPDTAGRFLHESYWRHLFARFGAFRSVHSWELVNEAAPGDGPHFALTRRLAELSLADGNPHPASISTWATLPADLWNHPDYTAIDHADFHAYVRNTGWLEPREALANDTARLFHAYDVDARARVPGKPIIWGEMGVDVPATTDEEDPGIALDLQGVWLHKLTWARCGPGGVIPLYWWPDQIFDRDLHGIFGTWKRFMDDIPLSNGRYQDAAAVSSHADLRAFGQKDLLHGRAHLWIDNARHTWRRVVDGESIAPVSGNLRIPLGLAQASVRVDLFDTASGLQNGTLTLETDAQGDLVLPIEGLATDLAVKLRVTGGAQGPSEGDWPQHQRDAARTGRAPQAVPPPFRARWIWAGPARTLRNRDSQAGWPDDLAARSGHSYANLPANSGASFAQSVQPVVAAGRIFIGSMEGVAYAVSTEDGGTLWSRALPGPTIATAAVAGAQVIFVSVTGEVAAFDVADGTPRWQYDAGRAITGAPCLVDGLLLVGTQAGRVHALQPADGAVVWISERLGPSIHGGLAAGGGRVFVGTEDMRVHALSLADGSRLAQRQVRGQSFRMLWPVVHDGRVWISSVTTPVIGSEYIGEANHGSFLFADSPTLAQEEANLLRWLDGDTNNGRWPDAGADWRRLFALNVEDLSEPFVIPAAPADGCGVPPHPPIVDGQGRLLTYFKTRHPALTVANGGVFGTQYSVDIAAIHPDTGRRVPLDGAPLANPWPWETDNLFALSSAGSQLWLRQNFRGTLMMDLNSRSSRGVSAEIRNRDGGVFNFDVVYRDSGSPVARPQNVPLGRAAPVIVDGRVYILEDWGLTAIEHRP